MNNPSISVILSVYNGAPYLKEAIESILNQTFEDFEFIIVDDGSTDATSEIIDMFTDSRIIRLYNKNNLGLVESLNKALAVSQGKFIARMDADDISHPDRFQKQLFYLEHHSEVGILGTAMAQIDERGRPISVLVPPSQHELILWQTIFGCAVFHATVLMRRDDLIAVSGYDVDFLHSEDLDLWSRLFNKTKFANLPEVLYTRRLHRRSIISTQFNSQHRNGIIIRRRLLKSILGCDVSPESVTWFLNHDSLLNRQQKITALNLLIDLYEKIIQTNSSSVSTVKSMRTYLIHRIILVNQSWPKLLLRRLTLYLGKLLPSPVRHKLKVITAKLIRGGYLKSND
ncbi:glycosyltransferase [Patescibacteria group bacterium]|nr:glycosyltransferase [Patescibacteria group bacterium]